MGLSTSPFIASTNFGAFIFFGIITSIGALWVYFFVPETKGRTLEEMDELFGEVGFAQADLQLKAQIEREIGLTALLDGEDVEPNGLEEKVKGSDEHANELVEKSETVS